MKKTITNKTVKVKPIYKYSDNLGDKDILCQNCRHANQETSDFSEGFVACKFSGGLRMNNKCDATITLMSDGKNYYMYEQYNGKNCTWLLDADFEVIYKDHNK